MLGYIIRRVIQAVFTVLAISIAAYMLLSLVPTTYLPLPGA